MLISYKWLKKYLPELDKFSKNEIADALTTKLVEVEGIKPVRQELSQVICGEVVKVQPLEGSNKLSACQVNTGRNELRTIICGAPNVIEGIKVAVCLPGGCVYDVHSTIPGATFIIEARPVMGTISEGMICSAKELGLSNDHDGILILEAEMQVGSDLINILQDEVLEIENKGISHRPDCFSHLGIARELAAMLTTPFQDNFEEHPLIPTKKLELEIQSKVDVEMCSRFSALCLADIKVTKSPLWLQSMLTAVGTRPINNIVDAANYIMFDKGQPLHTYDYDKVDAHKLVVRMAKNNERIKALDGKEYDLDQDMLVIANGSKVDDIAGIMGGSTSEISMDTKNIIIEAATFNMYSIRRTSRKLSLRTEASTRFEKGQDPNNTIIGLKSAVQLILDLAQGEIASEIIDQYPQPRLSSEVDIDLLQIKRFLGIDITVREVIDYLDKLGLEVKDAEKVTSITASPAHSTPIKVVVPSYRNDLKMEVDILEEIARLYGYDNFNPTLPSRKITGLRPNKVSRLHRAVVNSLTASGLDELYTYSFVGEKLYETLGLKINDCLKITNPLSPELSHMRNLLLPNLIEKILLNAKRYDQFKYFEIGRVLSKELDNEKIHIQPNHVAGVSYSIKSELQYPVVKGSLENLFKDLALKVSYKPFSDNDSYPAKSLLHEGRSALIIIDDQVLGFVSELHPVITNKLGIQGRVGIFEIDLSLLVNNAVYEHEFKAPSIFQSIKRDLSFKLSDSVTYGSVVEEINSLKEPLLKNIDLVDVFLKTEEQKSKYLTITIEIQSQDRTLTDNEIIMVVDRVVDALTKKFKAELR